MASLTIIVYDRNSFIIQATDGMPVLLALTLLLKVGRLRVKKVKQFDLRQNF